MKKYICTMIALLAVASLASCGTKDQNQKSEEQHNIEASTGSETIETTTDAQKTEKETKNYDAAYEDTNYETPEKFAEAQDGRSYGITEDIEYYSETVGRNRLATVMLPADYSADKEYPVLYVLGGWGGGREMWVNIGAKYIVQNAHYDYGSSEMIVVSASVFTSVSGESQDGLDFSQATKGYDNFINDLEQDLMPYINSHYAVKTGSDNTAIAGLSLGGRESYYIGLSHPEQFGYIAGFSTTGGLFDKSPWGDNLLADYNWDSIKDKYHYLLLSIGEDDPYLDSAFEYNNAFSDHDIKYSFYMMEGGHEASVWQNGLYNFARRIF